MGGPLPSGAAYDYAHGIQLFIIGRIVRMVDARGGRQLLGRPEVKKSGRFARNPSAFCNPASYRGSFTGDAAAESGATRQSVQHYSVLRSGAASQAGKRYSVLKSVATPGRGQLGCDAKGGAVPG